MKAIISATLLAAMAASTLLAASPASAATWSCTARDRRDAHFSRSATGSNSATVKAEAADNAMAACLSDSAIKRSCVILSCTGG